MPDKEWLSMKDTNSTVQNICKKEICVDKEKSQRWLSLLSEAYKRNQETFRLALVEKNELSTSVCPKMGRQDNCYD